MVYNGLLSAGCAPCRKAKKRCGREQPVCVRCERLKLTCSGYKTATAGFQNYHRFRFEDENRTQALSVADPTQTDPTKPCAVWAEHKSADAHSPSPDIDSPKNDSHSEAVFESRGSESFWSQTARVPPISASAGINRVSSQDITIVAINSFQEHFVSAKYGFWKTIEAQAMQPGTTSTLDLAIRACGIAALPRNQSIATLKVFARGLYAEAVRLLNRDLSDATRRSTDETLIAVVALGYYETIAGEGLQYWTTHITSASRLLQLRGREQLGSPRGRMIFRETASQILSACLCTSTEPPAFLGDWEREVDNLSSEIQTKRPPDSLTDICFSYATLKANLQRETITQEDAMLQTSRIDARLTQWSIDALASDVSWNFSQVYVTDSRHVWNGLVHVYNNYLTWGAWMTYRILRILLSRNQEVICLHSQLPPADKEEILLAIRSIRHQTSDDICAAIPSALGKMALAKDSSCCLIDAHSIIWPLYLAGICVLERVQLHLHDPLSPSPQSTCAASAQYAWILDRLDYVRSICGIELANHLKAVLGQHDPWFEQL